MPEFAHSWKVDPHTSDLLGAVGTVAALGLMLSPVPIFRRVVRSRDTGDVPGLPYVLTLAQCTLWTLYCSWTPGRTLPLLTNAFGIVCETVYVCLFARFSSGDVRKSFLRLCCVVCALVLIFSVWVTTTFTGTRRANIAGAVTDCVNISMFISPLAAMGKVMRSRSVASLPISLSLGMGVCALAWVIYGVYVADITILIPNAIGFTLATGQVALWARYMGTEESRAAAALAAKTDALAAGGVSALGETEAAPLTRVEVGGDLTTVEGEEHT